MVNCKAGGDCNGGDPVGVYEYGNKQGIPDSSCIQYTAKNLNKTKCEAIDICRDCTWPPPAPGEDLIKNCWAVPYKKYYVSKYYSVVGAAAMKAEIYKNGPISCGIEATHTFDEYYKAGEIYSEKLDKVDLNHEISVVGWGYDEATKTEYWIGRNSWGTYWGDYGFFMMKMYSDNLGIETDCSAGIPSFTKPHLEDEEFIQ